jgi:methyl-accepting chemotaxis protein
MTTIDTAITTASSGKPRLRLRIRGKLMLGFATVSLVLAAAVGATLWQVQQVSETTHRVVDVRVPTAHAGEKVVSGLYASLAALRGWIIAGNDTDKAARQAAWAEIREAAGAMDGLARTFSSEENRKGWEETRRLLEEFAGVQAKVEAIANTPDAQPAAKLLATEGAPRVQSLAQALTGLIDQEAQREAMPERMQLLKAMADLRGNSALAIAELRAFLLTGDAQHEKLYGERWAVGGSALGEVRKRAGMMTDEQRRTLDTIARIRGEFGDIAKRMIAIRSSAEWNVPVHLLRTEAAPRANRILDILEGAPGANGVRHGGLTERQIELLQADAQGLYAAVNFLNGLEWSLLAIGIGLGLGIALLTSRSIVNPIRAMTGAMTRLAGGDKAIEIPAVGRQDEIGDMAGAVQVFKESMIEADRLTAEQAAAREARERRAQRIEQLNNDFDRSVTEALGAVANAAHEMSTASQSMAATAEETNRQAVTVAAASEQVSANVQTVSAAAEELSNSIEEIGRQVNQAATTAGRAASQADATDGTVRGLAEAAQRIGDVVRLISDIAGQTNLLALNATIEAARAGDAGKGFAVVASEVKQLANQTAKATEDIAAQVNAIQSATQGAVEAIRGIGTTVQEINGIATAIASAIEEQGAATKEIARNVQQASGATGQVSSNITGVTQAAGETGAAAEQVKGAVGELSHQADALRAQVDSFLEQVRAA